MSAHTDSQAIKSLKQRPLRDLDSVNQSAVVETLTCSATPAGGKSCSLSVSDGRCVSRLNQLVDNAAPWWRTSYHSSARRCQLSAIQTTPKKPAPSRAKQPTELVPIKRPIHSSPPALVRSGCSVHRQQNEAKLLRQATPTVPPKPTISITRGDKGRK